RYVAYSMQGKSLNDIKGTCNIEKAYYFEDQSWDKINLDDSLEEVGKGFVIKVIDDCKLDFRTISIPKIPIESEPPPRLP
ncbi:unnamed protein product, partial [marine sediment metagenome]